MSSSRSFRLSSGLLLALLSFAPATLRAQAAPQARPAAVATSQDAGLELFRDPGEFRLHFDRLQILHDPENQFDIDGALNSGDSFVPNPQQIPNLGFAVGAYWVRFRATNRESTMLRWYLELAYPVIDEIEFYLVDPRTRRVLETKITGDIKPFAERDILHRNFIFEMELPPNQPREIYMRVASQSTIVLPLTLGTRGKLAEKDHWEQAIYYMFYGVMLVMFFYNLFLFVSLRDASYLYYVFYILFFGLYMSMLNGIAFHYLWPNNVWWNQHFVIFCLAVSPPLSIRFTQSFLVTKENAPGFHKFFNVLLIIYVIPTCLVFYQSGVIASKISVILGPLAYGSQLAVGVVTLMRGYHPARFFLLASTVFVAAVFMHAIRSAGFFPGNFFTFNSMQWGMGFQVVLLSLALADRINTIKREKESAQEEAIALRDQNVLNLQKLNKSFSRFVPDELLNFLEKDSVEQVKLGDQVLRDMTVMFIDIRSFTSLSEKMSPKENFDFLNSYLRRVGPHIRENGGIIDKYIGDAIMALFPGNVKHPIDAAIQIQDTVRSYNRYRIARDYEPISVGIGMHLGTLMLGIIGEHERLEGTVISDSVNIASRLEGLTKYYGARIIVSGPLLFTLEDATEYAYRFLGVVQIKGKEEPIAIYEVMDGEEQESRDLKIQTKSEFEHALDLYIHKEFEEAEKLMTQVMNVNPGDLAADYYIKRCRFLARRGTTADWKGVDIMEMK